MFADLARILDRRTGRVSSWDATGRNADHSDSAASGR